MVSSSRHIKAWGRWVQMRRKGISHTRRELAKRVDIDPSYVTLIERDGYVPKPDKVIALGRVLGDVNRACVICRLLPPTYDEKSTEQLAERCEFERLTPECRKMVTALAAIDDPQAQNLLTHTLRAVLGVAQ